VPDLIGFVDAISASPSVRLDLSDGVTWRVNLAGTDLTPPRLKRASYGNFLSDGEHVAASTYTDRMVTLALTLTTATTNATATQLQLLARELDRATNILRWWPAGATNPVFFESKRSDHDSIQQIVSGVTSTGTHTLTVPIRCKPFALGLRQDVSAALITNDPATGCYFDVASPLGDVETPLYIKWPPSVIAAGRKQTVLAVRRRGTPGSAPWILQAESMTLTGATTLPGADATASGSGSNYARATGLTSSFVTRMSGTFGATPSTDARGKYRLYARVRKTSATGEVRVRLAFTPDGVNEYIPDSVGVVLPNDTVWRWADLGVIQLPMGDDPFTDGPGGAEYSARGYTIRLQFSLTALSSNIDVDCVVGMPADDRLTRILWPGVSGATSMILDSSARPKVYGIGASGELYSTQIRALDSAPGPVISPGAYNRIWVLDDAGTTSTAGHVLSGSMTVNPYYWPRYLSLRPQLT
jgi:hypothetical protein